MGYQALKRLEKRDIDLYVGIPFCPTRCAYCSFVSQSVERSFSLVEPYVKALIAEIRSGGDMVRSNRLRPRAFYMGGGTPGILTPDQMDAILTALEESFDLSACPEITVEIGRPDTITAEKLAVLKSHGVTRVCVNPQTMEDHVLAAIGRRHVSADTVRAMELVRAYRFPHVNMDLIAGLPEDTPEGFRRSLDKCLELGADDITIHTLALKKGSRILMEGLSIPDGAGRSICPAALRTWVGAAPAGSAGTTWTLCRSCAPSCPSVRAVPLKWWSPAPTTSSGSLT